MSERWELPGHFESRYSAKQKMTLIKSSAIYYNHQAAIIKLYMRPFFSYYIVYLEYNSFGLNPASSKSAGDGGPCYLLYLSGFHSLAPQLKTNRPTASMQL